MKKKKTPSPGDKDYIDWVNKINKVPRQKKTDTKKNRKKLLDQTVIPGGHDTSPTSLGQLIGGIVVIGIVVVILFTLNST